MARKKRVTIKMLRERPAWEVAELLGLQYTGDTDCISHGGMFFRTEEWDPSDGYADAVTVDRAMERGIETVWLEAITILPPTDDAVMREALKSSGVVELDGKLYDDHRLVPVAETEAEVRHQKIVALWRWGHFAAAEDTRTFTGEEPSEFAIAKELLGMLRELAHQA